MGPAFWSLLEPPPSKSHRIRGVYESKCDFIGSENSDRSPATNFHMGTARNRKVLGGATTCARARLGSAGHTRPIARSGRHPWAPLLGPGWALEMGGA